LRRIQSLFSEEVRLKFLPRPWLLVAAILFAGCNRQSSTVERLGILPANLLISDPAFGWLKEAVPIALQYDLLTAHTLVAGLAADESGATRGGATRVLRTSIESRQGGLHIESTIVDATTEKVLKVAASDASSASVILPALNTLAKKIDPDAIEFSTRIQAAWQALATAEENTNPQQRAQFLNQAISRDQNFGFAWVSLMEMIVPNRQADLQNMIDEGKAHRAGFSPFDRAKFDLVLDRLSNAAPAEQIRSAQEALKLAPNDLEVLTTLGNYQLLQGDLAGGEKSLRRAIALNPANISLRFQLGRGLMELRKFKEAETVLASMDKTPAVYPELAACTLLQGDKARASIQAEKFIASIQNEELRPLLRADWEVLSGDRQQGIDLILGTKFPTPNVQTLALSQAVIWQLMGHDYSGVEKTVARLKQAPGPLSPLPVVADLLADKTSSAADWRNKVQRADLPDSVRDPLLAYGFFLRGNYDDATKAWQHIAEVSHGTDLHARAMLASSLDHLGKAADAHRIAVIPFAPDFSDLYAAIAFTEMRRMLSQSA
jgi:tetratricopeptide (TPR) repeat protein